MILRFKTIWLSIFTTLLLVSSWKAEAGSAYAPKLGLDSSGNAVAVWERNEGTHRLIQAAVFTSGAGWAAATTISENGVDSFAPLIAINSSGDAVALWTAVNSVETGLGLYAKELPSGGSWSSLINVSTNFIDVLDCRVGPFEPCQKISLNDDGDIVILWTTNGGPAHVIHSVTATFGGVWNAPVQISP